MKYHIPALLDKTIEGLNIKTNGVYVDVTFGGGGHSKAILKKLGHKGRLIAFDQDQEAVKNQIEDNRFTLINHNFIFIKNFLNFLNISKVDGILADLGVSFNQFDKAERGFSFRYDSELDMRMNEKQNKTAKEVLNTYKEEDLHKILGMYGEVKNAKLLAKAIVSNRSLKPINTTFDLLKIIDKNKRKKDNIIKYYSKIFQALRIEVNNEIDTLKELLQISVNLLNKEGRLVIISYHSIEDRIVKNLFLKGNIEGKTKKDPIFGSSKLPFRQVNKKLIVPSESEIKQNKRSRSAKLRIGELN